MTQWLSTAIYIRDSENHISKLCRDATAKKRIQQNKAHNSAIHRLHNFAKILINMLTFVVDKVVGEEQADVIPNKSFRGNLHTMSYGREKEVKETEWNPDKSWTMKN